MKFEGIDKEQYINELKLLPLNTLEEEQEWMTKYVFRHKKQADKERLALIKQEVKERINAKEKE